MKAIICSKASQLVGCLLLFSAVHASVVATSITRISYVMNYPDQSNGDVVFALTDPIGGCTGFWMAPTDVGFKQSFAALMMAKASQASVMVYAHDNQIWPGSASPFCKATVIRIE